MCERVMCMLIKDASSRPHVAQGLKDRVWQTQQFDCCEVCGGSHFSSNCQIRNPLVYEPNSSNNYDFSSFDQPPQYHIDDSKQLYYCEHCRGPHYGSDCQMVYVFYEHAPYDNHDSSGFDQPSQFTPPQPIPLSELTRQELIKYMIKSQEEFNINQEKFNIDDQNELNRLQYMLILRNLNQDPPVDLYDLKGSDKRDNKIDSLTKKPSDTHLMGDEVISTTPIREKDEFIKSSVDDFFPILRDSEVTSVCDDLECNMPITTHLPTTDVREEKLDIDLPLGEHLDTFSMGDREIDFNPSRDIEELERLLADDLVPVPRVFDKPLGNSYSVHRSYDVTFSNPLFDFNDDYTLCYDNPLFDEEYEDISSLDPPELTPVIDEFSLLVTPPPDSKQLSLREMERFDPFFSLTQSGEETRVMETPSFGFHHMP
nr:NAC domain-containing protein [Tanacetum cinerariifolium]